MELGASIDQIENKSMESEIQFGQVEHSQPDEGLRPDQDKHFAVVPIGRVSDSDLPIFVDMDVLRDMEAHARENTRVELGGVMLGQQHIDANGEPFVVITDSLRAKHYEATKGSFKFTHETWNQITRERNEYRSNLEMVGWYHTHPGWGVFLSGMDLFICNNFFSRPLDVALVIEPCAGERGWFQWENGETRETGGFFLMTNRHRIAELNYFSDIFNNQNPTISDPRFRQPSFSITDQNEGDSMVNVVDNRRPVFELAIVSMLFLQLLMAGIFGYRLLNDVDENKSMLLADRMAKLEEKLDENSTGDVTSIREQAYATILDQIVSSDEGKEGLAEKYANIESQNKILSQDQEALLARINQVNSQNKGLNNNLDGERKRSDRLEEELRMAQDSILSIGQENDALKEEIETLGGDEALSQKVLPPWLLYGLAGAGLLVAGAIGGTLLARARNENDDQHWDEGPAMAEESGQNKSPENISDSQKVAG